MDMWYLVALLIGTIIVQEIMHRQERKDLYNRIMARDLTEYNNSGQKPQTIKNVIRKNYEESRKKNPPV